MMLMVCSSLDARTPKKVCRPRTGFMQKDWGYSALVEARGKRILFDTGNDPVIFANNAQAKGVDLATIDFVVMSHRHSDHMGGLSHVLAVNPKVKMAGEAEMRPVMAA